MKNDKIIVVVGIAILILAAIGVYFWVPQKAEMQSVNTNDFIDITGDLKDMPDSITVSSSDPFYPLIATPLSVNYDETGDQMVIPLYVMNFDDPSTAITRLQDQLARSKNGETIKDDESPKNASLRIATHYWTHSRSSFNH